MKLYRDRNFKVRQLICNNQYECIRDDLMPTLLTIVGAGEHVRDVERSIRTVKEGARTITQGPPFKWYPGLLVDSIVQKGTSNLNSLPVESGVSDTMSPREIIPGLLKLDYNNLKLEIGEYYEVYAQPNPTNRMDSRSVGGIALQPSNNNGGHYFMFISTGERLHSYACRQLPITHDVILQVERLAKKEKQSRITKGGLKFEWFPGNCILDDKDDKDAFDDDYETEDKTQEEGHDLTDNEYTTDDDLDSGGDNDDASQDQRSKEAPNGVEEPNEEPNDDPKRDGDGDTNEEPNNDPNKKGNNRVDDEDNNRDRVAPNKDIAAAAAEAPYHIVNNTEDRSEEAADPDDEFEHKNDEE